MAAKPMVQNKPVLVLTVAVPVVVAHLACLPLVPVALAGLAQPETLSHRQDRLGLDLQCC